MRLANYIGLSLGAAIWFCSYLSSYATGKQDDGVSYESKVKGVIKHQLMRGHKKLKSRKIDAIIIHSTQCFNLTRQKPEPDTFNVECVCKDLNRLWVSAHYIIDRKGRIYSTVPENYVAYHGGKGWMPDRDNRINTRSIGIEILNLRPVDGVKPTKPTGAQYYAALSLVKDIQARHKIKLLLRHSDVAPHRRTDPWNFDWNFFMKELGKPVINYPSPKPQPKKKKPKRKKPKKKKPVVAVDASPSVESPAPSAAE